MVVGRFGRLGTVTEPPLMLELRGGLNGIGSEQ